MSGVIKSMTVAMGICLVLGVHDAEGAEQAMDRAQAAASKESEESHVYKQVDGEKLALYVFNPKDHKAGANVPAIVFYHGGGWRNGSPRQFQEQCRYLAGRGMVAITVEYRLVSKPGVKLEDCIEDAKSAMRWVRANADDLGVDPKRIAAGGGSAGGHLAACTAVIDDFDAKSDPAGVSAKPDAMVLFNPALGLTPEQQETRGRAVIVRGSMEKCVPLTYASAKQPPCIMFFGTEDDLLKGAVLFEDASTKAGNNCTIVTYEGQRHSFFNQGNAGGKYYRLTVAEMDKFLVEIGWLTER